MPLPLDHERGGSRPSRWIILLAASRDQLFRLRREFRRLRSVGPRTLVSGRLATGVRSAFRRAPPRERKVFGFLAPILRVFALAVTVFGRRRGILFLA